MSVSGATAPRANSESNSLAPRAVCPVVTDAAWTESRAEAPPSQPATFHSGCAPPSSQAART